MMAIDPRPLELHVQTALHEYDSLRQESLNAIAARVQIVGYVFTGLALVIAGITVAKLPPSVAVLALIVFVPTLAKLSIVGWLIEYRRSQRAGVGLAEIERRINMHIDRLQGAVPFRPTAMGWESGLIKRGQHTSTPYGLTLLLIYTLGLLGTSLGISRLWASWASFGSADDRTIGVAGLLVISLAVDGLFLLWCRRNWLAARSDYVTKEVNGIHDGWMLEDVHLEGLPGKVELRAWVRNTEGIARTGVFHFFVVSKTKASSTIRLSSHAVQVPPGGSVPVEVRSTDTVKRPKLVLFESTTLVDEPSRWRSTFLRLG